MSASGQDRDPSRGEISPEDREALRKRAEEIGQRLDSVKARKAPAADAAERGASMGQAFKIAIELVVGVAVGGFIGWVLDRQLGTMPWLLIVFVMLGFAAGMLNVIRQAQRMQKKSEPLQRAAPSVGDDDEGDR